MLNPAKNAALIVCREHVPPINRGRPDAETRVSSENRLDAEIRAAPSIGQGREKADILVDSAIPDLCVGINATLVPEEPVFRRRAGRRYGREVVCRDVISNVGNETVRFRIPSARFPG